MILKKYFCIFRAKLLENEKKKEKKKKILFKKQKNEDIKKIEIGGLLKQFHGLFYMRTKNSTILWNSYWF